MSKETITALEQEKAHLKTIALALCGMNKNLSMKRIKESLQMDDLATAESLLRCSINRNANS